MFAAERRVDQNPCSEYLNERTAATRRAKSLRTVNQTASRDLPVDCTGGHRRHHAGRIALEPKSTQTGIENHIDVPLLCFTEIGYRFAKGRQSRYLTGNWFGRQDELTINAAKATELSF